MTLARRNGTAPRLGHTFLHTAIDDHSWLAYTEILTDETKDTASAFLRRATAWFATAGVRIQRVLTDNGSCYRSRLWAQTCTHLGITPKRTRPHASETERRAALAPWLHLYNHHRGHTALNGLPPPVASPTCRDRNT